MSEPLAKQRYTPGDGRTGAAHSGFEDPLAELARLVGRDDPFRDIFPARSGSPKQDQTGGNEPVAPEYHDEHLAAEHYDSGQHVEEHYAPGPHASDDHEFYAHPDEQNPERAGEEAPRDSLRFAALPVPHQTYGEPNFDHPEGSTTAYDGSAARHAAPQLQADLWAEGVQDPALADQAGYVPPADTIDMPPSGSRRRTFIVLAAVIALTGGGLAATFLVHGNPQSAGSNEAAPTILADTAPTKVQPPETANASTGGDGTTALLEKSASDNVANAKVVNAQEQPVDLAQLPKAATGTEAVSQPAPPTTQQNGGSFPEPRKVKTILIRPDGSVVGEAPAAPSAAIVADGISPGVVMPTAAPPASTEPVAPPSASAATPATPKSTARAATTPKATPRAAPKPKPVETASATPDQDTAAATPATGSTGAYAVQLAAPPSEDEAKSISARLQKKFADALAGRRPAIHKADSGSKSVYRVRVGNLSQDDAKALCSKLQTSGGSCFVVHN